MLLSCYMSSCPKLTSAKYAGRPGPPRPANEPGCHGRLARGNNGQWYISTPDKRGIHTWKPLGYEPSPANQRIVANNRNGGMSMSPLLARRTPPPPARRRSSPPPMSQPLPLPLQPPVPLRRSRSRSPSVVNLTMNSNSNNKRGTKRSRSRSRGRARPGSRSHSRSLTRQRSSRSSSPTGNWWEPMLGKPLKNVTKLGAPHKYFMSEKLNGIRAAWDGRSSFWTRGKQKIAAPASFRRVLPRGVPLNGELYAGRGRFGTASSLWRSPSNAAWLGKLQYRVFDMPKEPGAFEAVQARLAGLLPVCEESGPPFATGA